MAKRKKFRLRNKPTEPVRKMMSRSFSLYEGCSLKSVVDWAAELNIPLDKLYVGKDYGNCYYEGDVPYFEFYCKSLETDSEYRKSYAYYHTRLKNYKKWHKENKKEIELELKLRGKENTRQ